MHYDAILKSILNSIWNSLTPKLTGGAKPVRLLSVEFPSVESRVPDLVVLLDDGRILHLEVQSANDPRMPWRMLHYRLLLRERYPLVHIVQHVLYIGAAPCSMVARIEEDFLSYGYRLTDIREIDEEVFLRSESAADRVLAVLAKMRNERVTIRRILASWAGAPRRERADLIKNLVVLSGLRRLNKIVVEEVHNMPITIDLMENSTIREWIESGLEQGRQLGRQQGLEQGIDQGQASLLSMLLSKRFGPLPPETEKKLQSAHSDQLERWALRLIDAATLDEVFVG